MVLLFVCFFVAVLLAVFVVVSSAGAFCLKNGINKAVNFLQSYVNFPTLNKMLLTDLLNFASKRNFPSFPSFRFQYKGQNQKLGTPGNPQLPQIK